MKIALAHNRLDLGGGTERDFYLTAEGLRDLGHEVHLFCGEFRVPPPRATHAHRVPYLRLGRTAQLLSFAILGPKAILPHRCDVLVSFGRMVSQDVLRSGGGSHRVFLEKMRHGEGALRNLWRRLSLYHRSVLAVEERQFHPQSYRKVLAVSQEVKRELIRTYSVSEDRIEVVYNGVDPERFHPRNRERSRAKIKAQWGIPAEAPLVLFVGTGFQRKGLDRLLKSWGSPRLRGVYLLVVGDDAHLERYRSWALTQGQGSVILTGRQDNIEDYYGAADLLALPSFQEAFGNVILEALASGVPVLTTKAVGAAELLLGELTDGILLRPDDPIEIQKKIRTMLDPHRRSLLTFLAREIGERYSWSKHFLELNKYLGAVCHEKVVAGKSNYHFASRDHSHDGLRVDGACVWTPGHLCNAPNLSLFADPDRLLAMPQCEIIKDEKKIRVARVPLELGGERRRVYLKRYNAFSWRYRLESLFVHSGAFRSWLGVDVLMSAGFHTAKPIAAVERRSWGMLTRSFYLSEEIPIARTVDEYWNQHLLPTGGVKGSRRRREFLNSLARLFRSLHETGIYHNDLKDANILFSSDNGQQDGSFYLLDLEGIRRYRHLNSRRRLKNLVQLNRTMGKSLRWSEKLYLLKVYLGDDFFTRGTKRKWIQRVLKYSERKDQRSLRKS